MPDYRDIPIIGPIFGGILGDDKATDAGKQQEKLFKQLASQYEQQRDPTRMARMNSLRQTMSLFEPMNEYMQKWYGYKPYDMEELLQDPIQQQKDAEMKRQDKMNRAFAIERQRKAEGDPINWNDIAKMMQDYSTEQDKKGWK